MNNSGCFWLFGNKSFSRQKSRYFYVSYVLCFMLMPCSYVNNQHNLFNKSENKGLEFYYLQILKSMSFAAVIKARILIKGMLKDIIPLF